MRFAPGVKHYRMRVERSYEFVAADDEGAVIRALEDRESDRRGEAEVKIIWRHRVNETVAPEVKP